MNKRIQSRMNRLMRRIGIAASNQFTADYLKPDASVLSAIFDAQWYQQEGGENLEEYLEEGWRAGHDPGPLFSTRWYLERYPDVVALDVCPLLHFLAAGVRNGYDPNPFFSAWWYTKVNPDLRGSQQFPFLHYLNFGAAEGRPPGPLFDPQWYCTVHPEVAIKDAVGHYRKTGWRSGDSPHPLFDVGWYQTAYPGAGPGRDPVEHYLLGGWAEGHRPNPLFYPPWYQEQYPDGRWLEPLTHYVVAGQYQGYPPSVLFDEVYYRKTCGELEMTDNAFSHYLDKGSRKGFDPHPMFDGRWYQSQWTAGDAEFKQLSPIGHYLLFGYKHHCNPSALFDSRWYQESLAGLADTGLDPLEHYLMFGQEDGRAAFPRESLVLPTQAEDKSRYSDWLIPLADDYEGRDVVIIACHDQRHRYGLALRHMVSRYHAAGWKVVVGFDHSLPDTAFDDCKSIERPDAALASPHEGYDFFTWRLLLEELLQGQMPRRVLMSNDSVIGPLQPLDDLTQFIRAHPAEVLGFVESRDQIHHLQSWGIVFQGRALNEGALWRYFAQAHETLDKRHLINRMEVRLARWAATQGYRVGSICSPASQADGDANAAVTGWRHLLSFGIPFIKREVFTLTPHQIKITPAEVTRELSHFSDVDVEPLIADALAQIGVTDLAPMLSDWHQ